MSKRLQAMGQGKYQYVIGEDGHWNGDVYWNWDFQFLKKMDRMKPRRIFVNSMSDLFHEQVPFDLSPTYGLR